MLVYLVMNATINALYPDLDRKLAHGEPGAAGRGMTLGIQTLETGVFGGVVIGLGDPRCIIRFNEIALPQFLVSLAVHALFRLSAPWPRYSSGALDDRGLAAFSEAHFWPGGWWMPPAIWGLCVWLHPAHAWPVWFTPYLLFTVLDHRAWTAVKLLTVSWLRARSGFFFQLADQIRSISMRARRASCPGAL